ncbi:MAG: hypothetical protein H0T42_27060, partial [Deltaproteobacteria bacterium]|nr:hypothetical protein [Deltaproteobacteria bacterium]
MDYVTFLLDLSAEGENRAVRETVAYRRSPKLRAKSAFEWKIICDARCKVIVVGHVGTTPQVLATASWHAGTLAERKHQDPKTPNGYQWKLVEDSLRAELARRAAMHDRSGEPPISDDDLIENIASIEAGFFDGPPPEVGSRYELAMAEAERKERAWRRRWLIRGGAITAVLAVCIIVFAYAQRASDQRNEIASEPSPVAVPVAAMPAPLGVVEPLAAPEPVEIRIAKAATIADAIALAKPAMTDTTAELGGGTKLFATYAAAKLRWADVDVAAETTVGHVLKDPEVERGKRMCTDGVIGTIERRDLELRKVYVGSLRL